jgi:AraC-like DNA-binding protein
MKLIEVANAVGYKTDAAFGKAFKRLVGAAQGEYRKNYGRRELVLSLKS